jgi:hypothetical protein
MKNAEPGILPALSRTIPAAVRHAGSAMAERRTQRCAYQRTRTSPASENAPGSCCLNDHGSGHLGELADGRHPPSGALSVPGPMLDLDADPPGGAMIAPDTRNDQVLGRPACSPSAIRAVLAANADAAVLSRYDADLDAAFDRPARTATSPRSCRPSAAGGSRQTPGATPRPSASSSPASNATSAKDPRLPSSA